MRVIDLSTLSLTGGSGMMESKIPIWWSDGTNVPVNNASGDTIAGSYLLMDGSLNLASSTTTNGAGLFTLSSNWLSNTQYALEYTIWTNTNSNTAYAELWDITSGSAVTTSQVSTTSTSATIVRSGKMSLILGHSYGVTIYVSISADSVYMTDASLIVFPQ